MLRSGDLAARLCGPPVAFFLLGRHDLADVVRPLLELCGDDLRHRRAVLCALMVSAAGATDPAQLQAWADEMQAIDDLEPTGLGGLMRWLALAWRGDFVASVEVCVKASLDPRIRQGTRDMFVGIATLDHFSLTDATDDPHGLIERALEVADRSDVAIHRVTCLLGAAWGLAGSDPDRSLRLVRRALDDIANVPALTRLTLPGSASRLLTRLDPRVAAQGLLEQLDATPSRRSFVDLIPLVYATALLHRLGHPSAGSALATMSVSPIAPYLSMMDFVDLARRASSTSNLVSLSELETMVREALTDIVNADDSAGGRRARLTGRPGSGHLATLTCVDATSAGHRANRRGEELGCIVCGLPQAHRCSVGSCEQRAGGEDPDGSGGDGVELVKGQWNCSGVSGCGATPLAVPGGEQGQAGVDEVERRGLSIRQPGVGDCVRRDRSAVRSVLDVGCRPGRWIG